MKEKSMKTITIKFQKDFIQVQNTLKIQTPNRTEEQTKGILKHLIRMLDDIGNIELVIDGEKK